MIKGRVRRFGYIEERDLLRGRKEGVEGLSKGFYVIWCKVEEREGVIHVEKCSSILIRGRSLKDKK